MEYSNPTTLAETLKDYPMRLQILLLVEDDDNDSRLARRTIRRMTPDIEVVLYKSGETALDFLNRAAALPQLILLDIGLPGMDGIAFIERLRATKAFKNIPIVVLTGHMGDVARAYQAGVSGYLLKPMERERFEDILKSLRLFE